MSGAEDNEQLRQQTNEEAWYESQKRKDQARQFTDEWRRECKEWFEAFDKRMNEIFRR